MFAFGGFPEREVPGWRTGTWSGFTNGETGGRGRTRQEVHWVPGVSGCHLSYTHMPIFIAAV